jgi:hypothetical protein
MAEKLRVNELAVVAANVVDGLDGAVVVVLALLLPQPAAIRPLTARAAMT